MEEYRVNNQMEEVLDKELEALMESMPDYGRLEKAIERSIKRERMIKQLIRFTVFVFSAYHFHLCIWRAYI